MPEIRSPAGQSRAQDRCLCLQVGSIFEYANRNPLFGVVKPDSFLWAPILLFFAITGFPSAGELSQVHWMCQAN